MPEKFTVFRIDGFDYLDEIRDAELRERMEGTARHYELTIHRATEPGQAWLGGYAARPEFEIRFALAGQKASGRWRRKEYDGQVALFLSVGEIVFVDE